MIGPVAKSNMPMLQRATIPSRRLNPRISTNSHQPVWAYWHCNGRDDLSRVRDLGVAGLFLETLQRSALGSSVKIDFLVQEGQIRAEGIIRHVVPGDGIGLKLTAVTDQDRPHLAALMKRLRGSSPTNLTGPQAVLRVD
jgi:PilZ domain-containing protein